MPRHPIGYVSKSTGLSTHVVRVWERRYGAITPHRTETNRRLYSDADIDRLKLLNAVSQSGHTISAIAVYTDDELKEMLRGNSVSVPPVLEGRDSDSDYQSVAQFLQSCQQAVLSQDESGLFDCLSSASVSLAQPVLLEQLIGPLMLWVGNSWHDGTLRLGQEHLASACVKSFLTRLRRSHSVLPGASSIAIATPAGETHEIGALIASVAASSEGWRTLYFGPNLPASDLAYAAEQSDVQAVALSIALPGQSTHWKEEIHDVRQFLPANITLILGGTGSISNRLHLESPGVVCVESLKAFGLALRRLAA